MDNSRLISNKLHKYFVEGNKKLNVLCGIDIEFEQGNSYAITGASGSGKSTFLHLLGGLDEPSSGDVFWNGKSIFKFNSKQKDLFLNQDVGFIFQFHYLIKELTVLQNIMMMGLIKGQDRKRCEKSAMELLRIVDLQEKANSFPTQLSGGQQQRISVLRAIFNKPKFLLADEPTGNLDADNAKTVVDLLLKLKKEFNMGIILCSHDSAVYSKMESVFKLHDGILSPLK